MRTAHVFALSVALLFSAGTAAAQAKPAAPFMLTPQHHAQYTVFKNWLRANRPQVASTYRQQKSAAKLGRKRLAAAAVVAPVVAFPLAAVAYVAVTGDHASMDVLRHGAYAGIGTGGAMLAFGSKLAKPIDSFWRARHQARVQTVQQAARNGVSIPAELKNWLHP